jgi:hypothetical protein
MSGGVELDIYGDDWNLDNIDCNASLPGIAGAVNYTCQIKKERMFDMSNPLIHVAQGLTISTKATCIECNRVFNLLDEDDAGEYYFGHDCETEE